MSDTFDTAAFFGGTAPAVSFDDIGETHEGTVIRAEVRQQTGFEDGALQYWPDGRPKLQAVVTFEGEPDDDEDDGVRTLYVRGLMHRAFQDALRTAKLRDLSPGSWFKVTYTGDGEPPRRGMNGPKQYEVVIAPPKRNQ